MVNAERRWLLAVVTSVVLAVTMLWSPTAVLAKDVSEGPQVTDPSYKFVNSDGQEVKAYKSSDGFVYSVVNSDGTAEDPNYVAKIYGKVDASSTTTKIDIPNTLSDYPVVSVAMDPRNPVADETYDFVTEMSTPANMTRHHYFRFFESMKAVSAPADSKIYYSANGVLFKKITQRDTDDNDKEIIITKKCLDYYPAAKADTAYVIPEGIQRVNRYAFHNNLALTKLTFPKTLAEVDCGFLGCENLATLRFTWEEAPDEDDFDDYEDLSGFAQKHDVEIRYPTKGKNYDPFIQYLKRGNRPAIPQKTQAIALNDVKKVEIKKGGEIVTFAFTPAKDGDYHFFSSGSCDTQGYVQTDDELIGANDDDEFADDDNFGIYFQGKAGTKYYLQAGLYEDDETGTFTVSVKEKDAQEEPGVVTPPEHNIVKVDAVKATAETEGNIEYWACTKCGNAFADAEGKTELEKGSWIIAKDAAKVKAKVLKAKAKKKTKFKAKDVFTVTNAEGRKVTYKKTKGNKKITVSSGGAVKVKKGLKKKKTYRVKVTATIAGNDRYEEATKKLTLKVKIK